MGGIIQARNTEIQTTCKVYRGASNGFENKTDNGIKNKADVFESGIESVKYYNPQN